MQKLLLGIITATLGLWLASMLVPGVQVALLPNSNVFGFGLTQLWQLFLLLGIVLGLVNFYVKPILDTLTLPLRIITLGLFSFVVNMGLIFTIDYFFREFSAPLLYPLLWTTLIIWALNVIAGNLVNNHNES